MADFSLRNLPIWLELSGRAHPGQTARVVLTGAGGGSWLVPLGGGGARPSEVVDVELEVDVVAWCHRVGERVTTDAIVARVEGDAALARDLLEFRLHGPRRCSGLDARVSVRPGRAAIRATASPRCRSSVGAITVTSTGRPRPSP